MTVTQQRARIQRIESVGAQTVLRVAFPTPGEDSLMARSVDVLMRVLDDGMSTRLHRRICDDLGLAYDLSAGAELFNDVGVMDVATSVVHESVARLIDEVLGTLGDLALSGPSRAEMQKVQHRYVFDLAALDDDPHGLADFYGAPALWNRRNDLDARRHEILRLTPDHIRRAARAVFAPSRLNLTMVGTVDDDVRYGVADQIRKFRNRVGHVVAPTLFPSTRTRRPLTVRFGRHAAALDSLYASP
jgi:predicted Zn-dependent peptidase